jgi:thioredoxin:protein disulfide reductase
MPSAVRKTTTFLVASLVFLLPALAYAAEPCAAVGSEATEGGDLLADGYMWMYLSAFGVGILTSLTPCVYPMIPIVVGVFGARDDHVTRRQAFALATLYVIGMGITYSVLGVIFALLGKQFGTILANPWVVIPLVGFYVVLATSMFGAFELNLPASWQARLSQVGGKGYGGALGMGLVGGLTAAPCTGPFLAGILGFVATTKNVPIGSTLLFTYAIGMGILFWVLAAFTVSLPRSGRWLEWSKSIGGVALLAVAIYFLRPLIPALKDLGQPTTVFLVGSVAITVLGIAVGAVHLSFHDTWSRRFRKAAGLGLMLIGITGAVNWVLTPDRHLPWVYEEQAAFAQANAEGKGVMVDFAATWCAPCAELELTFATEGVYEHLVDNYVPLKFDVTEGNDTDEERQERYNAETLPAVVFLDAQGRELGRVREYLPPADFMKKVEPATERLRCGKDAAETAKLD